MIRFNQFTEKGQKYLTIELPAGLDWPAELAFLNPHYRITPDRNYYSIPYNKEVVDRLFHFFKKFGYVDYSQLSRRAIGKTAEPKLSTKSVAPLIKADDNTDRHLAEFRTYLERQRYSKNTVKTYVDSLATVLRYFDNIAPEDLTNTHLEEFNTSYIMAYQLSQSYQNQVINAVKLFCRSRRGIRLDPNIIERPRRERKLPNVLSKEEVKLLLSGIINVKHRMMLVLIYACGLRRGELLNLRPTDILSERNLLFIRQSKGKKDRCVPISDDLIEQLREYFRLYRPKVWLFEGQTVGQPYSPTSLEHVLKQQLERAKIQKPVTLHWLRHSYATHLLESGTNLRYIQEILGHSSSRTTEIYTHVSNWELVKIISPYDTL